MKYRNRKKGIQRDERSLNFASGTDAVRVNTPVTFSHKCQQDRIIAVLSHQLSNGQERPFAYASQTMSDTEQRYPQIDKETLAIIWAVQKFFYYLCLLITDQVSYTDIQRSHCQYCASVEW